MLTAAPAKNYAHAQFLLHAVLILWVLAVNVSCRLWCGLRRWLRSRGAPTDVERSPQGTPEGQICLNWVLDRKERIVITPHSYAQGAFNRRSLHFAPPDFL